MPFRVTKNLIPKFSVTKNLIPKFSITHLIPKPQFTLVSQFIGMYAE
jgi:hypothetical protein